MRRLFLLLGILIIAACMAAPLPALDTNAPFSSHMLRHTALLLVAAPLLAMAIPSHNLAQRTLLGLSRLTARLPVLTWLAGILTMWLWHIPAWYNATAHSIAGIISCAPLDTLLHVPGALHAHGASTGASTATSTVASTSLLSFPRLVLDCLLPIAHDLSALLAGFLFCWPVITPYPSLRLSPLRAVLYLATACVCCSLLGLLITFAPAGTYQGVGMTDKQIGGLIMWVPCCFLYLVASMALLISWLSKKEMIKPVSI